MIWLWELSWLWKMLGVAYWFRGMRRRGRVDRQRRQSPPRRKGFPARLDLGLCDLYSGDLLSCTDAGAALSYRSGPLFRSGARFGLSILPLHTSSMVLLHAACNDSTGRPLASKPRWITRVIIRGRQCRLAAIRLRHDIDHDWELSASRVFNSHGFFRVMAGYPSYRSRDCSQFGVIFHTSPWTVLPFFGATVAKPLPRKRSS